MRARHRIGTNIALLLLAGVVLTGCGGVRKSAAATTPEQGKQSTPAAAVAVTPMGANFVLTDTAGLTLYYFAQDEVGSGISACDAACVASWPPVTTTNPGFAKPVSLPPDSLSTIKRSDGSLQIAYAGRPLYRSSADHAPGETKGQSDVWLLAKAELICDCFQEH